MTARVAFALAAAAGVTATAVGLAVDNDPSKPVVPVVVGLNTGVAAGRIADAGLCVRFASRHDHKRQGTILLQSPAPGTRLAAKTPVLVVVAMWVEFLPGQTNASATVHFQSPGCPLTRAVVTRHRS